MNKNSYLLGLNVGAFVGIGIAIIIDLAASGELLPMWVAILITLFGGTLIGILPLILAKDDNE